MKVDIALVAVEHAVRIFVLSNYFLHYAMLHKLEVLAGGLVQSDCGSFLYSFSESIKDFAILPGLAYFSPFLTRTDHCYWVKKTIQPSRYVCTTQMVA